MPALGITNSQLATQLKALTTRVTTIEVWKGVTGGALSALTQRIVALEAAGGGASSAELAALKARMDAIEAKVCPQESRIASLEADHVPE